MKSRYTSGGGSMTKMGSCDSGRCGTALGLVGLLILLGTLPLQGQASVSEVEPNDEPAFATGLDLTAGSTIVTGALDTGDDVDYYSFSAPPGAKLWILLDTGGADVPGAAEADPYLSVIDKIIPEKHSIEEDDDDGIGNGGGATLTNTTASAIAGLTLTAGGTYYLQIETFGSAITAYNLYVTLTTTSPQAEAEPNNTVDTAGELVTLLAPKGLRSGVLDSAFDQDLYRVETLAGNTLVLELDCDPDRAGSIYLALDLIATNRSTVLYSSEQPDDFALRPAPARAFSFTAPETGTYYVRVRHSSLGRSDPTAYHLMVLNRGPGTLLFSASSYVVHEGVGSALIQVLREGGSAGVVTVEFATSNRTAVAPADYTPVVQTLTFANGVTTQFVNVPIVNDAVTESNEVLVVTLGQPTGGAGINSIGRADLVILDDDEWNDNTPATATPVIFTSGFAVMNLTSNAFPLMLSPENDQDWFVFSATAGARLWAFVDTGGAQEVGANTRDAELALFASDGTTFIEEDDDDGSGTGAETTQILAPALAGRVLAAGGTYYLRVKAYETNQVIAPYTLYMVLTTDPSTPEVEGNDLQELALPLVSPYTTHSVYSASLSTILDEDYYSITVPSNSVVYFSADCDPERDGQVTDVELDLFDPNLIDPLFHADASTMAPNSSEAFSFQFPDAGVYYLRVSSASGSTGTYLLMGANMDFRVEIDSLKLNSPDVWIRFNSRSGKQYEIWRADHLNSPAPWTNIATLPGNDQTLSYPDLGGMSGNQRYYRVREVTPP